MSDASSIRKAKTLPSAIGFYRGGIRWSNNQPLVSTGTQWAPLGNVVLSIPVQAAADAVDQLVFVADRPYSVVSVTEAHTVIAAGAFTVSVNKCIGTQAASAGNPMISAAFDLNAVAANTVTTATLATPTTVAQLTAVLSSTGTVASITITNAGAGYGTTAPTIYIQAPSGAGTQAAATCTLSAGAINAVTVGTAGTQYDSAPQVIVLPATAINTGDRIALDFTGTATGLSGAVVTIVLQPL